MPRLKRRADAISRDPSASEAESEEPQPRRRRRSESDSPNDSGASSDEGSIHHETSVQNQEQSLVKKLVRLALATEYSRTPLRRSDISTKILKNSNGPSRSFRAVFEGAQKILKDTFGMQLLELPSKERTNLKERRLQATQTKASSSSSSSKSWILISILPAEYKTDPTIVHPTRAPDADTEASYTALYTFVLSLIYLNNNCLPEQKLARYLRRVNADTNTPFGMLDKVLQRMQREGYIDKRRDTVMGEEVTEWFVGPRGKVEVGIRGVTGLVRSVYGHGALSLSASSPSHQSHDAGPFVKIEEEELNAKLSRSLGIKIAPMAPKAGQALDGSDDELADGPGDEGSVQASPSRSRQTQRPPGRRGRRRQIARDDDDDDDDDANHDGEE